LSLLVACALLWCLARRSSPAARWVAEADLESRPSTPALVPEWIAEASARQLSGCDGTCLTKEEQESADELRNSRLFLPPSHLENPDAPRLKESLSRGWIVVYLLCIVYMFAALAIVCDEFFVPALEAFVDEFGISMDVAGATFMAAGGSMPELFTSFISTFQEHPAVGFAAIVGSAVFNVLFVIAVCAIFSSEVMTLSWWPLARDCSFYMVALVTVVIVLGYSSPGEVQLWEAVVLLLEYLCYCSFMRFNGQVEDFVKAILNGKNSRVTPVVNAPEGAAEVNDDPDRKGSSVSQVSNLDIPRTPSTVKERLNMPSTFRRGIVQLLTQNSFLYETAGIAAVVQIKGSLEETFQALDLDGDGFLDANEIRALLTKMGLKRDLSDGALQTALRRITRSPNGQVSFESFKKWYLASEARIEIEVRRVFDAFDQNQSNSIDRTEIKKVLESLGHKGMTDEQISELMDELTAIVDEQPAANASDVKVEDAAGDKPEPPPTETAASVEVLRETAAGVPPREMSFASTARRSSQGSGRQRQGSQGSTGRRPSVTDVPGHNSVSFEQFQAWYTKSLFCEGKKKQHQVEEESEGSAISLDPPECDVMSKAMFWYVITYPIVAVLYCTLPDVRKEKYKRNYKIAILEFSLSLFWIGAFSNLLYECTVVLSNTFNIDPDDSAITVLAAGTSIPDLLSSYIVARQGEGDMAVSSSIGSNIFDVTVGLPLPWMCYNLAYSRTVAVDNDALISSVMLLVVMLFLVILVMIVMRWRMTKRMGYVMLALYALFLLQYMLEKYPKESGGLYDVSF
jgi:K+-dependent Na+/Ca+ exchanger-like protein